MSRPPFDDLMPRTPSARRFTRRRLLLAAAGAASLGPALAAFQISRGRVSGDVAIAAPTGTPSTEGSLAAAVPSATTGTPTRTPPPIATPVPVTLTLSPPQLGNGEAIRVRTSAMPGAVSASLVFNGTEYAMLPLGDGQFWAVIAAPMLQAPGPTTLAVVGRNAAGTIVGTGSFDTSIVFVTRPVQYLQATEEQTAVLTQEAAATEETLRQQQFAAFDIQPRWHDLFLLPIPGEITTDFGQGRSINNGPITAQHTGTDFAGDMGDPVRLAAPGRVAWAGAMPIRGNSVIVDHGGGVKSGYHHLNRPLVAEGQALLPAGTIIAEVGASGFSTGPHLHWELTVWGVNVDPMTWTRQPFDTLSS